MDILGLPLKDSSETCLDSPFYKTLGAMSVLQPILSQPLHSPDRIRCGSVWGVGLSILHQSQISEDLVS